MADQQESVLTDKWTREHLFLQRDYMIAAVRRILETYMPADVLAGLKDKFAMVCRPLDSGATVIRPELLSGLYVVVLSLHLIPKSYPPLNFPREYIALVLLHELAHVQLGHRPPSTDQMEADAYSLALDWFNATQHSNMTLKDLQNLNRGSDRFWLVNDQDPKYEINKEI